jgi:hypothetical protein
MLWLARRCYFGTVTCRARAVAHGCVKWRLVSTDSFGPCERWELGPCALLSGLFDMSQISSDCLSYFYSAFVRSVKTTAGSCPCV